jgi:hypothetical protein
MVRAAAEADTMSKLLDGLQDDEVVVVADWKMKFLMSTFREVPATTCQIRKVGSRGAVGEWWESGCGARRAARFSWCPISLAPPQAMSDFFGKRGMPWYAPLCTTTTCHIGKVVSGNGRGAGPIYLR